MEINWQLLVPYLLIITTFGLVLIFDMIDAIPKLFLAMLTIIGSLLTLYVSIGMLDIATTTQFNGMLTIDRSSAFFNIVFSISTALVVLLSIGDFGDQDQRQGQFYLLMLLSMIGMMLMAGTTDLVIVFLGLELMSLPLYILAAYAKRRIESSEAGMKYLLLGAFSSAFFLYGIALLYAAFGSTRIDVITIGVTSGNVPLGIAGLFFLIVGFGFKVGLVPFHQWAPDVYQGSPMPATAFIASGPKAAGFAAFFRVFAEISANTSMDSLAIVNDWLVFLAILTMTVGNLIALSQNNVKRILAYSSIAHAGYVLIALTAGEKGIASSMIYLLIYCVMNIGAFGVLILARGEEKDLDTVNDFNGLGFRSPLIGLFFSVMLFSLAGFPPTAGFIGKFYVFRSAIDAGKIGLVVIAALNTAVSAFYYIRVIVAMYMREPREEIELRRPSSAVVLALIFATILVIAVGIMPTSILKIVQTATFIAMQ